ncbi:carbohydrate-binding module family 20 domain-containing protein [Streptomyces sp. NPDC060002]|uniref:carbohydrate-binding module family 20 domain-containing protein n=1 Tax=Streptomyces sp. NPDC060002 TaxID=3347033 RepID=UPI003691C844
MTFGADATTSLGTDVRVVGSIASMGSWNTADAVPPSSASSPVWSKAVIVPKSVSFAYEFLKKDGSGNVTWDPGRTAPTRRAVRPGTHERHLDVRSPGRHGSGCHWPVAAGEGLSSSTCPRRSPGRCCRPGSP